MSYGYVYVAQISMGADYAQTVKAIAEAEAYPGPSLILAYAPCINHGIKKGMSKAQTEEKLAVETGYREQLPLQPGCAAVEVYSGQQGSEHRADVRTSWEARFVMHPGYAESGEQQNCLLRTRLRLRKDTSI